MKRWCILLAGSMLLGALGCGGAPTPPAAPPSVADDKTPPAHDHSGWWCDEHGVVEAECSLCQGKVFKKLKPEEICKEHPDRAKAQCFVCNPSLWPASAARYKAKYGKEPPLPEGNQPGKM